MRAGLKARQCLLSPYRTSNSMATAIRIATLSTIPVLPPCCSAWKLRRAASTFTKWAALTPPKPNKSSKFQRTGSQSLPSPLAIRAITTRFPRNYKNARWLREHANPYPNLSCRAAGGILLPSFLDNRLHESQRIQPRHMHRTLEFLLHHGYAVLLAWVFAEQAGVPIPSLPLLLAAGALAGSHQLNIFASLFFVGLAAVSADSIWYQ